MDCPEVSQEARPLATGPASLPFTGWVFASGGRGVRRSRDTDTDLCVRAGPDELLQPRSWAGIM